MRFLQTYIAIPLILLYSLYHGFSSLVHSTLAYNNRREPDPVTAFEKRLQPLKLGISTRSHIGYMTDIPENKDWFVEYLLTQYTLAPAVVEPGPLPTLCVLNLRYHSSSPYLARGYLHRAVVLDAGNGAILLAKRGP